MFHDQISDDHRHERIHDQRLAEGIGEQWLHILAIDRVDDAEHHERHGRQHAGRHLGFGGERFKIRLKREALTNDR